MAGVVTTRQVGHIKWSGWTYSPHDGQMAGITDTGRGCGTGDWARLRFMSRQGIQQNLNFVQS